MNGLDLDQLSASIDKVAIALNNLGTGNAATDLGAIEFLAMEIKAAGEAIGGGLNEIAEAIRESSKP